MFDNHDNNLGKLCRIHEIRLLGLQDGVDPDTVENFRVTVTMNIIQAILFARFAHDQFINQYTSARCLEAVTEAVAGNIFAPAETAVNLRETADLLGEVVGEITDAMVEAGLAKENGGVDAQPVADWLSEMAREAADGGDAASPS